MPGIVTSTRLPPPTLETGLLANGSANVTPMGYDQSSIDVVIRHVEGYSINLTAVTMDVENLLLLGTLINPEPLWRVETQIAMAIDPDLRSGRHIERVSQLTVTASETGQPHESYPQEGTEIGMAWRVETQELEGGYRLHDARVSGEAGEMRAFGLEDLVATVGAGIFGGLAAIAIWRTYRVTKKAQDDVRRQWQECLDRGGSPVIMYNMSDQVGLTPGGARIGAQYNVSLRCDMPR